MREFLRSFLFQPIIEVNGRKRVYRYHRTLMIPWFHQPSNVVIMAFLRLVSFFVLLIVMCIYAGFYNPAGVNGRFRLPNDGDPVTWILRFGNITAIICLCYLLMGVMMTRNRHSIQHMSQSWGLYILQILWLVSFPLSILSMVEYYSEVRPNSTLMMGEEVTITTCFMVMMIDFLFGSQYFSIYWTIYPLNVLNLYLTIVMIVSLTGVVVYPALPWMLHPGTAFLAGLVVNLVLIVICAMISVVSRFRFRVRIQNNEAIEGAYEFLATIPEKDNLTKDTEAGG